MIFREAHTQFDFFSLMQIRSIVFMCEQHVDPKLEIDADDMTCKHYIVLVEDKIVGTCRILKHDAIWHIGRVAVLKKYRSQHIGSYMLSEVETIARASKVSSLQLGAQIQAKYFYTKNGFVPFGEVYLDADIEHIMMEKIL